MCDSPSLRCPRDYKKSENYRYVDFVSIISLNLHIHVKSLFFVYSYCILVGVYVVHVLLTCFRYAGCAFFYFDKSGSCVKKLKI